MLIIFTKRMQLADPLVTCEENQRLLVTKEDPIPTLLFGKINWQLLI